MDKQKTNLPERKKIRLEGYDYSKRGAYFITICLSDRKPLLWSTLNVGANCVRPDMLPLSPIGKIVKNEIEKIDSIYDNIRIKKYCIMPDHIHMIIVITADKNGRTQFAPTISRVIKQFKGSITKQLGYSIWQKSFIDRIIRNEKGYQEAWEYITNNPLKLLTEFKNKKDEY